MANCTPQDVTKNYAFSSREQWLMSSSALGALIREARSVYFESRLKHMVNNTPPGIDKNTSPGNRKRKLLPNSAFCALTPKAWSVHDDSAQRSSQTKHSMILFWSPLAMLLCSHTCASNNKLRFDRQSSTRDSDSFSVYTVLLQHLIHRRVEASRPRYYKSARAHTRSHLALKKLLGKP